MDEKVTRMPEQLSDAYDQPIFTPEPGHLNDVDTSKTDIYQFAEQLELSKLDAAARIELIKHAGVNDFIATMTMVHQVVAPDTQLAPVKYSMSMKDKAGNITNNLASPESRYGICDKAVNLAHQVIEKYEETGGDIDNVVERLANLAAFSIVLAHPFEDGNGRTARTIGSLIRDGYQPDDLKTLSTNRPTEGYRIFSYVPDKEAMSGGPNKFLESIAAIDVPFETKAYQAEQMEARGYTTPYEVLK